MKKVITSLVVAGVISIFSAQSASAMQLDAFGLKNFGGNLDSFSAERLNATVGNGITIHLDNQNSKLLFSDGKAIELNGKFMFIWSNKAYTRSSNGKWATVSLDTRKLDSDVSKYSGVIKNGAVNAGNLRINANQLKSVR